MNSPSVHVAMGCNHVAEDKLEAFTPKTPINTESLNSKYIVQGELGRGKFAVVKKCVNFQTGEEVAAKFIKKRRRGKNCREQIHREIVMLELSHPHPRVVDIIEVFESATELILITEYCSGGELFHECVIEESFKESDVVRLLGEILDGVLFLHHKNILHLDLKPQNILLTKPFPDGNVKICDLGLACLVNAGEDIREIVGTPDYVAPEVLSYEPLGLSTDMWSLGVLTYVMLTACSPFGGDTKQETFLNISQVNLDFPDYLFEHISYGAVDFMKRLLVKDPRGRMDAAQCLSHPWIRGHPVPRPAMLDTDGNEDEDEDDAVLETEENHTNAISPSSSDKCGCQKDVTSLSLSPCGQSSPVPQGKGQQSKKKKERTGSGDGKLMGGSVEGSVDSGDLGEDDIVSDDVEDKILARKETASTAITRGEENLAKDERQNTKAADSSYSYALNGDISEDDSGCVDSVNNNSSACNDDSDA